MNDVLDLRRTFFYLRVIADHVQRVGWEEPSNSLQRWLNLAQFGTCNILLHTVRSLNTRTIHRIKFYYIQDMLVIQLHSLTLSWTFVAERRRTAVRENGGPSALSINVWESWERREQFRLEDLILILWLLLEWPSDHSHERAFCGMDVLTSSVISYVPLWHE